MLIRSLSILALAAWMLPVAGACKRRYASMGTSNAYTVRPDFGADPLRVGTARVKLDIAGLQGRNPSDLKVEGNMSHPGMAPSMGVARELSLGHYEADVPLTMVGDWYLSVTFSDPEGKLASYNFPFRVTE